MKNLINKAGILSLIILAISFLGCEEDDETGLPTVVALFTQTQIENTGVVSFINLSENANSFLWDFGDGTSSTETNPTKNFPEGTFTVSLTAINVAGSADRISDEIIIVLPEPPPTFDSGLLTNGDFEAGVEPWIGNAANVQTEGGNSFNLANVETAGNAFDVNLSQVVALTQGTNYILTFNASSDRERTILAGIGLNEDPFTNTAPEVTLTTATQTFTLQLSAADFGSANSRVIFDMGADVGTVVIDNVSLVEGGDGSDSTPSGGGSDMPTEAAPAPTQDAANVTSVFSNAYTNVDGTNPRAFGNDGGAEFSEIQVAGDDVWSYANTNFVGLQNDAGFDGRTNFSMDIWVAEDVSFRAGLISFTDPVSREDVEVNLTGGEWTTIDVALADLVPSLGSEGPLSDNPTINQIIFDVLGDGVEASIFVDNVFFYTADSGAPTAPTMAAPAPTQDAANVTSVFSNTYMNVDGTNPRAFGNDGGATFSEIQVEGDDVWSYASTNFVGLQNDAGFDGRTNFNMDIWVAEDISFRAGLISFTDPVSREDVEVNLTGGQWNNIDVALADLIPSLGAEGPLPDNPTINQIIFDVLGDGVEADIFVDNVFFYTADGGGGGTPGESPFCETPAFNNGDSGNAASGILLTIANVDAQSMIVTIESTDMDAVDDLIVNAFGGPITGSPAVSAVDSSVAGQLSITLTWTGTPPTDVDLNVLWSKENFAGNYQLNTENTTVPFAGTCDTSGSGGGGGTAPATFPLDFEDGANIFNAFEGATVAVIDNPQTTGNASSRVLELGKPAGAPFFAGINSDQTLGGPSINLADGLVFTVRIWSPIPNINVRMRLEQEPGVTDPPAFEIFQTLGNANEWVTLTFDFSTTAAVSTSTYTRLVLNTDWDTDPSPGATYFIDDIIQQ